MPLHASVRVGDVYAPRRADRGTVMLSGSVAAIVTPRGLPTYSSRTEQATFRFSEGLSPTGASFLSWPVSPAQAHLAW
jgi:hypothetical protein